jgi:predicted ABC-type ATPase
MLAGPNGAGKSTFHEAFLADSGLPFVNADRIAAAAGLEPYEAARAADLMRRQFIERPAGFIAETVFSDPVGDKLALLKEAMTAGFDVTLIFIGLASVPLAQARVATRVQRGGHDVPDAKIAARFPRTLENLKQAIRFVPRVNIYDNSDANDPFRLVAEFENGRRLPGASSTKTGWFAEL